MEEIIKFLKFIIELAIIIIKEPLKMLLDSIKNNIPQEILIASIIIAGTIIIIAMTIKLCTKTRKKRYRR